MELSLNIYTKLTVFALGIFAMVGTFGMSIMNMHTEKYCYTVIDLIEERGTFDSSLQNTVSDFETKHGITVNVSHINVGTKNKYKVEVSIRYKFIGNLNVVDISSTKYTKVLN